MTVTAPTAPGRPGQPVEQRAMLAFLADLTAWRDGRRAELDELDRAALAAPDATDLTGDMTLAMTLWQAVAARADELERVWDSGRVGQAELQRLSGMVWGRLDGSGAVGAAAAALAVSLPEACRLSDALVGQLRRRLSLDPVSLDLETRVRSLRATVERVRDLVVDVPSGPAKVQAATRLDRLDLRAGELVERARRGADVGGLIGPLEADAAIAERDLIVAAATRRDDAKDRATAESLRAELAHRAAALGPVVDECVAAVSPAPVLAVPRVEALGPVPADAAAVDAYLDRLAAVSRALDRVERAYRAPLAELADLRGMLGAYHSKAASTGRDAWPEVSGMYRLASDVLGAAPTDLDRARAAVAAFRTLLDLPTRGT